MMIEDLVAMARAAQHDDRLADGALYGKLADVIERRWHPIATAPKDGTHCLFIRRDGKMTVDWWDKDQCTDRFWKEYGEKEYRYTNWMPLPPPPETK